MTTKTNRRNFLISSLQSLGALGLTRPVIGALFTSIYQQAFAQTTAPVLALNPEGWRYVSISLSGGPPRWMFDLPCTPQGPSDPYTPGGFGTGFQIQNNTINVVNQTFRYNYSAGKSCFLPPVWGMGSASLPFTDLLPHVLMVRGMDMEINSHSLSNARQVSPIIGGYSLHGVIADLGGSPLPGVHHGGDTGATFKSKKGLGAITATNSGNPITTLIAPFKNLPNTITYRSEDIKPVVDQFLDRIDSYADRYRIAHSSLRSALDSADQLIRMNIDLLTSQWDGLLAKYNTPIESAFHPNEGELPGLFDLPIPFIANDPRFRFNINNVSSVINHTDLRNMITTSTTNSVLARQFALTEFLLTTGLTSTMGINIPGQVLTGVKTTETGTATTTIPCDQHGVGSIVSVLTTTLFYRGLLVGLSLLVNQLKQQHLFDKTILHVSSEFNRSPKGAANTNAMLGPGSGSDHGVSGGSATLISGAFNEFALIGNIKKDSGSSTYPGTWGVAAPWVFEDGTSRPIKVNDIARTVTTMTGTADIVANGYCLVNPLTNGLWLPKKSGGTNVG